MPQVREWPRLQTMSEEFHTVPHILDLQQSRVVEQASDAFSDAQLLLVDVEETPMRAAPFRGNAHEVGVVRENDRPCRGVPGAVSPPPASAVWTGPDFQTDVSSPDYLVPSQAPRRPFTHARKRRMATRSPSLPHSCRCRTMPSSGTVGKVGL